MKVASATVIMLNESQLADDSGDQPAAFSSAIGKDAIAIGNERLLAAHSVTLGLDEIYPGERPIVLRDVGLLTTPRISLPHSHRQSAKRMPPRLLLRWSP